MIFNYIYHNLLNKSEFDFKFNVYKLKSTKKHKNIRRCMKMVTG